MQELRAVLALQERVLGPENPATLTCCHALAWQMSKQNQNQETLTYAKRAYAGRLKVLGKDHPETRESEQLVNQLTKAAGKV